MLYFFFKKKKNTWRYHYFTPVYQKSSVPEIQSVMAEIGNFWSFFFPFTVLKARKIKLSKEWKKKKKKIGGDIIILHIWTKNLNHMMYGSWDTKREWQNFLSIWAIFCPFTILTNRKIKILKIQKALLEMPSFFHMCTKNHNHMMYGSWDIDFDRHNFLSFWVIFCPFTALTIRKNKILKEWRHHFIQVYQKSW